MLNRLFLFMVASYFLVGCTTESVDGFGKDNSLKDAVSVVYVKGAEDFCKTGDSTAQALSFKDFNSYEEFTRSKFQHANAHARKVKEYFRKNTQKGYENLIFLLGDGLFCQQLW